MECTLRQSLPGREMSDGAIGSREMAAMLQAAAAEFVANERLLGELDSISGDGDHGATMCKAGRAIQASVQKQDATPGELLAGVADVFMSADGGASTALFGAFFMGAGQISPDKHNLNANDLATAFESGLTSMRRYTKARIGDKTMIDALEPAVQALRDHGEGDCVSALAAAADASRNGAEGTKNMQARTGRAQHLGVRTLGHQDPGATTVALLFRGLSKGAMNG